MDRPTLKPVSVKHNSWWCFAALDKLGLPVGTDFPNNPESSAEKRKGKPSQTCRNWCNHSSDFRHTLVSKCILAYIVWKWNASGYGITLFYFLEYLPCSWGITTKWSVTRVIPIPISWNVNGLVLLLHSIGQLTFVANKSFPVFVT